MIDIKNMLEDGRSWSLIENQASLGGTYLLYSNLLSTNGLQILDSTKQD